MSTVLNQCFTQMQQQECPYCSHLYEEPVLLQCKHVICAKCAQTLFSLEMSDDKQIVDIFCPMCKVATCLPVAQGIAQLTRATQIVEKSKVAQNQAIKCSDNCSNDATLYCENCEDDYCADCFHELHFKIRNKWKNHNTRNIPQSVNSAPRCSTHNHPLTMFCLVDKMICCTECFSNGLHKDHESIKIDEPAIQVKKDVGDKLVEIDKQLDQIKQPLSSMDNLKNQVSESHAQVVIETKDNFDQTINQNDTQEGLQLSGLSIPVNNISLQPEALTDELKYKGEIFEMVDQPISNGNDVQVNQYKEFQERNQENIDPMLQCCESDKPNNHVTIVPVEQEIDKLGSICKTSVDLQVPVVNGLKEHQRDVQNVIVQWDPVQCDIATMYYVIQMTVDNDETTVKRFEVQPHITNFQIPIEKNWVQLVFTVHCSIDGKLDGAKSSPLVIDLLNDDPEAILDYFKQNCCQTIYERVKIGLDSKGIELDLSTCPMNNSTAIAVAKILVHFPQLQRLDLDHNQIGDSGASMISNAFKQLPQLQYLNMHENQIRDSGAAAIATGIQGLTELKELSLSGNQIGDAGAEKIATGIKDLFQLKKLILSENQIRNSGIIAIANGIKGLQQLQLLGLFANQFGDPGAKSIADGIKQLTQLFWLGMHRNQIGDLGAIALANIITQLTQLQYLYLYENKIGNAGATEIGKRVAQSTKLQWVDLSENPLSENSKTEIKQSIKMTNFFI